METSQTTSLLTELPTSAMIQLPFASNIRGVDLITHPHITNSILGGKHHQHGYIDSELNEISDQYLKKSKIGQNYQFKRLLTTLWGRPGGVVSTFNFLTPEAEPGGPR